MASTSKVCSFCGRQFPCLELLLNHEEECALESNHNMSTQSSKRIRLSMPPPTPEMMEWEFQNNFSGHSFCDTRYLEEINHNKYNCGKCGQVFDNISNKGDHEKECEDEMLCSSCGGYYRNVALFVAHNKYCQTASAVSKDRHEPHVGQLLAVPPNEDQILPYESAFSNRLASYFIQSNYALDLPSFLNDIKQKIISLLNNALEDHGPIKFNMFVDCILENLVGDQMDGNIKTIFSILLHNEYVGAKLGSMFQKLNTELNNLETKGSGWKLATILGLRLKVCKYSPLRGGCDIKFPANISGRKACINVPGGNNMCFKYAVLAKFIPQNHHRISVYDAYENKYDFSGIHFPTTIQDIRLFEKKNNITIAVFGLNDEGIVYPQKPVRHEKTDHRDLLLLEDGERRHYVWLKDFNKLVHSQITKNCRKINVCKWCMWYKKTDPLTGDLMAHQNLCNTNAPVAIQMPSEEDKIVKFKEVQKVLKVPFVVYADFEALLPKIDSCSPNPQKSYSDPYNKHSEISAWAFLQIDPNYLEVSQHLTDKILFHHRGESVVEKLLLHLTSVAEEVAKIYHRNLEMESLTSEERRLYDIAMDCYLCDKKFTTKDPKVKDHCHILGKYRGAAHQSCNLNFRKPNFLPVIFHNLSSYDAQFIIPKLNFNHQPVEVLAANKEKYISFSKYINKHFKIRFLDSYRFLPSSLDNLVSNLTEFPILSKYFTDPDQLALVKQKGVYPYEYMDSRLRFEETQLPSKEAFYSRLRHDGITGEEYQRAQKVWDTFGCENLGHYHDLYNKIDTLLLAEVFESFRSTTLNSHKLDPAQFFTTPQMTWCAMLRHTKAEIELLTDYDMLMMIESGVRGGLCQVSKRYAEANNPLIPGYEPSNEISYIIYQDCNALYATVMTKPLPVGEFQWVDVKDVPSLDEINDDDRYGYILDIDLDYPEQFHNDHNDLPFFPEKLKSVQNKLVAHLGSRKNYVVHYATLKQAERFGLISDKNPLKINRAIRFRQADWLRKYIEFNNDLRKQARNDFEKDLFKLYNNAIYGKTCENIRKRIDVRLITNYKQAEKLIAKSNFIDVDILGEDLVAIQMGKTSIYFDKPIYVGQAILDLSKIIMYEYMYGVMKPIYPGDKLNLLYMDTDSFIMEIKTANFYADMNPYMKENHLDTSNYPPNHELYWDKNKKELGKFKDEVAGKPIKRFVGLRPKMYALEVQTDNEKENDEFKKVKGVQRSVVQKKITFDDYVNCLKQQRDENGDIKIRRDICTSIRSKKHTLFSIALNKVSLSPFDDKRHILRDNIHTLALNHRDLRNENHDIVEGSESDDDDWH